MSERAKKSQRVHKDRSELRLAYEASRRSEAALREAVGRLLEMAQAVTLHDATTYADGQPRAGDDANPAAHDGKRWLTPKELAHAAMLAYPLVMTIGAQASSRARERLVLYAMHARELHQKERPGCDCMICENAAIAMAGMAGDVKVPPMQWLVLDEAKNVTQAQIDAIGSAP